MELFFDCRKKMYNRVSNKLECEQCVDVRDTIMHGIMGDYVGAD